MSVPKVSLHQLNIAKIENLDKFCRGLKIIYLQVLPPSCVLITFNPSASFHQDNAITRLENLQRLKCLEYINLAMNAIEMIEVEIKYPPLKVCLGSRRLRELAKA